MVLMMYFLIIPLSGLQDLNAGMSLFEFILLTAASVFIAIGGNILNDISDTNADSINKAGKNMVGRGISLATSWNLYYLFSISGIIAGSFLSYLLGQINYSLIYLFSAGLLWFYSRKYQCQLIIGNIVVSFLSAISFGLVWLFQFIALSRNAGMFTSAQANFPLVNKMVFIYMGFAFFTSFMREIVKDIEDIKGDDRFGCRTLPVVYGINKAKFLLIIISMLTLTGLLLSQYYFYQLEMRLHLWYFFTIDLMLVFIIVSTINSRKKDDYSLISNGIKILMLMGVLSMLFFKFY
jgi:4-hydroxybenzoate polyprenyltransferase